MAKQIDLPSIKALRRFVRTKTRGLEDVPTSLNPFYLFEQLIDEWDFREKTFGGDGETIPRPQFHFFDDVKVKDGKVKVRHIGAPNRSMHKLHTLFQKFMEDACAKGGNELSRLKNLPSSAAFVKGKNTLDNVIAHQESQYFYIVDIAKAYDSVNTDLFVVMLVAILKYDTHRALFDEFIRKLAKFGTFDEELLYPILEDPLAGHMQKFVGMFCKGLHGGLVTGAPSSPYLFNLYCEILIDRSLRYECKCYDGRRILYSRYADDLVFSDAHPIWPRIRKELRKRITSSGLALNHRKAKVLYKKQGTVFVTKTGIKEDEGICFSSKKRRHLHGIIRHFFVNGHVTPEVVAGHIAHFKEYFGRVTPTKSDLKTWKLCKEFERARANIALHIH